MVEEPKNIQTENSLKIKNSIIASNNAFSMNSFVTRFQVRTISRKLFANDIVYENSDIDVTNNTFEQLVSSIIQRYDPEDALANVPTILDIKSELINEDILDKIYLLNTNSVYIQVNNHVLGDQDKLAIIQRIKDNGYKIIVEINKEDSIFTIAKILADIIKIDIHGIPASINSNKNNSLSCKILAYNVDSAEDYALAEATQIDLYEGTYLNPSIGMEVKAHGYSKTNFVEIMSLINQEDINIDKLAEVISRDALMTAQIIRLSNSVYYGSKIHIESINEAIVRIGLDSLKKWIFLLKFSKNNNVPEELIQTSYNRALFCEKIACKTKSKEITKNSAYMIGLFSLLDVLTGKPIDKELSGMYLNDTIQDALIYHDGVGGTILNLVRAYEEANSKKIEKYLKALKINKSDIFDIYYSCVTEAAKLWKSLNKYGGLV